MIFDNNIYIEDIKCISQLNLPWEKLYDKSIMITGAAGLLGTFLVDLIMYKNEHDHANIKIYAVSRNEAKAMQRFSSYFENRQFNYIKHDVNKPIDFDHKIDLMIHGASNTHPVSYSTDPIGTITTNVIGTINVLDYALKQNCSRIAFLSSVEIYGENRGDIEKFNEEYLGYIDCNTLRAGYPEAKRVGEALCQAYLDKYGLDIVIPRFCRIYGPTMQDDDSKALAQFIRNAAAFENIVLKSTGEQQFSYIYVADAASALVKILLDGRKGEAYNIADESSDVTLKYLAEMLSDMAGKEIIFELPGDIEKRGFSPAVKAKLDADKLRALGWEAKYDIKKGLGNTVSILRSAGR